MSYYDLFHLANMYNYKYKQKLLNFEVKILFLGKKLESQNDLCKKKTTYSFSSLTNWLENGVRKFYRFWAKFVSQYSIQIIVLCFIITIICTAKMVKTK